MAKKEIIKQKTSMPEQDAKARARNFKEVSLGYTEEQAIVEASRCLQCPKRNCVQGCPVSVPIPEFIAMISQKDYRGAINKIFEKNVLPAICGRVCPQESQCEKFCTVGKIKDSEPVAIGRLERFVADWDQANPAPPPPAESYCEIVEEKKKVAIIGAGPAGLTCAGELAKKGYDVTVFEAFHDTGGVLVYGIPEFRLPKAIVKKEIEKLQACGVKILLNQIIGKIYTLNDLKEEGFEAVFIGVGAGLPMFLKIPGIELNGVLSANEFLTRINLMKAYDFPNYDTMVDVGRRVAVIGGGNVAMDSARCALRLGAEKVIVVYRRSEEEMPARREEYHHAVEEGIEFHFLRNPTKVIGDEQGFVKQIEIQKMELGEPDASGRRRPVEMPGSEYVIDVDLVIMAIGTQANPLLTKQTEGLKLNKWGYIEVDDKLQSSLPWVFAGGDIVTGSATVISAMGAGKTAAESIHKYLQGK
jgi:glutamate synthase (NADPH/NADH) small chain